MDGINKKLSDAVLKDLTQNVNKLNLEMAKLSGEKLDLRGGVGRLQGRKPMADYDPDFWAQYLQDLKRPSGTVMMELRGNMTQEMVKHFDSVKATIVSAKAEPKWQIAIPQDAVEDTRKFLAKSGEVGAVVVHKPE